MANHPYSSPPDYQPDDNWQASALCAQTDPALFFPDKGGTAKPAQRICAKCHHQWMFDHKPDLLTVTARWCPTCIPDVLPVMGNRGAA